MKRLLFYCIAFVSVAFGYGCTTGSNDCPVVTITAPDAEINQLRDYIREHQITATEDKRGFFYAVDEPGSGAHPTACSRVTVSYTGRLTDGTVFDQNEGITFELDNLVDGWKEGLPLVKEGGTITLYIPPTLAYGSRGSGPVPPNAILIFTIKLDKIIH